MASATQAYHLLTSASHLSHKCDIIHHTSVTSATICNLSCLLQAVFSEGFKLDEEDYLVIDAAYEGAKALPENDCFVWERGGAW